MGACDGNAQASDHKPSKHLGVLEDGKVSPGRFDALRMVRFDRCGDNQQITAIRKRPRGLFENDVHALGDKLFDAGRPLEIRAGAYRASLMRQARQTRHATATDADEMHMQTRQIQRRIGIHQKRSRGHKYFQEVGPKTWAVRAGR